jgi:Domain of Unknown Function with PDB structure (DUF3857)/Transglutaminase-like superfamily
MMRKTGLVLISCLLLCVAARAGDGDYSVFRIPASLLKNANAVIREDEENVVMKNLEKMVTTHHVVVTILNEKGDKYAGWSDYYDKFTSIESVEGILYDALGKKIKSLKKNEVEDVKYMSDVNFTDDYRVKSHNFYYKRYPYTVEYTTEIVNKETMFFPRWQPVPGEFVSVEKSRMIINVPADYAVRYKAFNYPADPSIIDKDHRKEYSWEISGYAAVIKEFASPDWRKITPSLLTGPSDFVIEDYKGKMSSWNDFGLFQLTLNEGRAVLPERTKQKVHDIIKDVPTVREKVALLYQYLQDNTRYIGIQLGIGGWRPFDATYVSSNGYGDCKALSNYMYSLLKEAGIPSYYTLIKAGEEEDDIAIDFPSSQFNHVIVCVPNGRDSIWLECTSQTKSPGYMGSFTGNRHALLITESGGKVVETPKYGLAENTQVRNIRASLTDDDVLDVHSSTSYSGERQDLYHMLIHQLSKDKVKEYLGKQLDFATYDVDQFNYKEILGDLPVVDEALDISVKNYATVTGKRLFITPNVMTRSYRKLAQDTVRKYDIQLKTASTDIDSVQIDLPAGYSVELLPPLINLNSPFGKYQASVTVKDNKLFYYRKKEQFAGYYPSSKYDEMVAYYEAIYKADRSRVVLVRNK